MLGARATRLCIAVALVSAAACQDYPFETRRRQQEEGTLIKEVITTQRPTDILFMIDNSSSMINEMTLLRENIQAFIDELSQSNNNYRLGFITPDIECNVPEWDCDDINPANRTTQPICCSGPPVGSCSTGGCLPSDRCVEEDTTGDGVVDSSFCDGGRLRSLDGVRRIFDRPAEGEETAWLRDVQDTITSLGCGGSGYEAGLEALRRAVVCSLTPAQREARQLRTVAHRCVAGGNAGNDCTDDAGCTGSTCGTVVLTDACPDKKIGEVNSGFIRDDAALAIVILSDEDDCSFSTRFAEGGAVDAAGEPNGPTVPVAFQAVTTPNSAIEQASHLCSPIECYAYHGSQLDSDVLGPDGLIDWADPDSASRWFGCGSNGSTLRSVNPPYPEAVADFLADIGRAKSAAGDSAEGLRAVRIGGIIGGYSDLSVPAVGFRASGCFFDAGPGAGVSPFCGCWANSGSGLYCDVTDQVNPASEGCENSLDCTDPNYDCVAGRDPAQSASGGCLAQVVPGPGEDLPVCGSTTPQTSPGGCQSMMGSRYVELMRQLDAANFGAGAAADAAPVVIADSICAPDYSQTIADFASLLTPGECYELGVADIDPERIEVQLNGAPLDRVDPPTTDPGWYQVAGNGNICLANLGNIQVGDRFEILLLTDN